MCYRGPNSWEEDNNKLLELIRSVNNTAKASHVLIMGDFRCKEINSNELWKSVALKAALPHFMKQPRMHILCNMSMRPHKIQGGDLGNLSGLNVHK